MSLTQKMWLTPFSNQYCYNSEWLLCKRTQSWQLPVNFLQYLITYQAVKCDNIFPQLQKRIKALVLLFVVVVFQPFEHHNVVLMTQFFLIFFYLVKMPRMSWNCLTVRQYNTFRVLNIMEMSVSVNHVSHICWLQKKCEEFHMHLLVYGLYLYLKIHSDLFSWGVTDKQACLLPLLILIKLFFFPLFKLNSPTVLVVPRR